MLALEALLTLAWAQAPSLPLWGKPPEEVLSCQREHQRQALPERMRGISALWLGRAYLLGPLGEWEQPDPDPPLRYDAFDCLTFVEEVLAISLAPDEHSIQPIRMSLRYQGPPYSYAERNHFMMAQWIPSALERGWLREVTPELPGASIQPWTLSLRDWQGWMEQEGWPLSPERMPSGEQSFWYWPAESALRELDRIPPGSLIFFVRQPVPHRPYLITHVGLSWPDTEQGVTLRHASRRGGRVLDEPLEAYLLSQMHAGSWPLLGLMIFQARDFGPRPKETTLIESPDGE